MLKITLSKSEASELRELSRELAARYESVEDPEFLRRVGVYAHDLPERLRWQLHDFKLQEPASALCLISGLPVDQERIGLTPKHWKDRPQPSPAHVEETMLVVIGSLLGEAIAWATQQDGYLVHDILPIQSHETEQMGSGSSELLWWHTEDAFHPMRGDYLGLLCLRNPDGVATTFANLEGLRLSDEELDLLFAPHYTIRPDESHRAKNRSGSREADALLDQSYRRIEQMRTNPEKIAVLSGDRRSPYLRIDPFFMGPVSDPRAQAALDRLTEAIEQSLQNVVLTPGDLCIIDNGKAVHGRRPFKARYDGTDRWLKRLHVTRDMRRSRDARLTSDSRVIH